MKINILSDKLMKEAGFYSVMNDKKWSLCKNLGLETSFNVSIVKDTLEFKIDILDERFLQPYDFQYILEHTPDHKYANVINKKVVKLVMGLIDMGIIEEYEVEDYI